MIETPQHPVALVLGATGTAGYNIMHFLALQKGWKTVAVSRSIKAEDLDSDTIEVVTADLTNKSALGEKLKRFSISHVFFAAAYTNTKTVLPVFNPQWSRRMLKVTSFFLPLIQATPFLRQWFFMEIAKAAEAWDDNRNTAMLQNVIEVCLQAPHRLQHVALVTGGKYNGVHLGPYLYKQWKSPIREDDPRPPGPNFYYAQEDFLTTAAEAGNFSWSVVRPSYIIGYSISSSRNLITSLAVYASILKELNQPLIFPGDDVAANVHIEMSDAALIADIMYWCATHTDAQNNAFNIVNGKSIRWKDVWPVIAKYFDMQPEFRKNGWQFKRFFKDKEIVWKKMVDKYGLKPHRMTNLLNLEFIEKAMLPDWDTEYSMDKARKFGFKSSIDNAEMFIQYFERFRAEKIIP